MDDVAYISYNLTRSENVSIAIYDITGKEVRALVANEAQQSGKHQLSFEANNMNTGTYFVRFVTDNKQENQMIIIE